MCGWVDVPGGHLPWVHCVGPCGEHDGAVGCRSCVPPVHDPDVRECEYMRLPVIFPRADDFPTQLGTNWACTLIGLLGLLLAPSPFLFYKYGRAIRSKSKFSPSPVRIPSGLPVVRCTDRATVQDLLIAAELEAEEALAAKEKQEV